MAQRKIVVQVSFGEDRTRVEDLITLEKLETEVVSPFCRQTRNEEAGHMAFHDGPEEGRVALIDSKIIKLSLSHAEEIPKRHSLISKGRSIVILILRPKYRVCQH